MVLRKGMFAGSTKSKLTCNIFLFFLLHPHLLCQVEFQKGFPPKFSLICICDLLIKVYFDRVWSCVGGFGIVMDPGQKFLTWIRSVRSDQPSLGLEKNSPKNPNLSNFDLWVKKILSVWVKKYLTQSRSGTISYWGQKYSAVSAGPIFSLGSEKGCRECLGG